MTSAGNEKEKEANYIVGFASAGFVGLDPPKSIEYAVKDQWHAGAEVILYRRRWSLSRVLSVDESGVFGKIGFVNADQVDTLFFDREKYDFVRGQAPSGVVVPFFISNEGVVTYQLIPGLVRESTFINALTSLLNFENRNMFLWDIQPYSLEVPYADWRKSVGRVTKFDLRLERPNPHYHGDRIAEELIEGFVAEYVRLTGVQSEDGNGIDTDSDPFQQALDHVLRNYGRATLTGVDFHGGESVWVKLKHVASRIAARTRISAPGDSEASEQVLRAAVKELPSSASAAPMEADEESLAG